MANALSIDVIVDNSGLSRLWRPWQDLWRRAGSGLPFLAPAWLSPWWDIFGTARPLVAVLYSATGLAAVLPLYHLGEKLLPMGVGLSDYFDVLSASDAPRDATERLLAAALQATDAARLDMPELPPAASLRSTAAPVGWRAEAAEGPVCPVLPLQPTPAIPKGMRRHLRQAHHRAGRCGDWVIETGSPTMVPALTEKLIAFHATRWQAGGVLADQHVLAFHRKAVAGLQDDGLLRLCALRVRGRVSAVVYALMAANRICFYLGGFDPVDAYISPGTLLIGCMLEQAARDGIAEAHFLRGTEAYKYALGAHSRRNLSRSFVRQ